MTDEPPGRIAVLLDRDGSLTPAETARAADAVLPVCFLIDGAPGRESQLADLREVAEALAPTAAADFDDVPACLAAVRAVGARWVTTFADQHCRLASTLNDALAGRHDVDPLWGRKDLQRKRLREAGSTTVRSARLDTAGVLRDFVREHGLPVVVKPVDGRSSRDVRILRRADDVDSFVSGPAGAWFVEEFIDGRPPPAAYLADYVSAEVFRSGGTVGMSFVTDRLFPASSARETGLILPTRLPDADSVVVRDTAAKALDVLGAGDGAYHVELKPRGTTAEIIEVNGRLGGFVARLARYAAGVDIGRAALAAAIGRPADVTLDWRHCAMVLLFQPPPEAVAVTRTPARRDIARLPGVRAVEGLADPGTVVDQNAGTNSAVARVWLRAADHDGLLASLARTVEFLADNFGFTDEFDRPVRGDGLRYR